MAAPANLEDDFPSELQDRLTDFDETITSVEEVLQPLQSVPLSQVQSKLSSLEKAKLDLFGAYAINSLFWMYLNTRGENPKEHGVKQELDRIRSYMARVKEIQEKEKAPKLDKQASKRFVRSALWQQAHKQAEERKEQASTEASTSSSASAPSTLAPSTLAPSTSRKETTKKHQGRFFQEKRPSDQHDHKKKFKQRRRRKTPKTE